MPADLHAVATNIGAVLPWLAHEVGAAVQDVQSSAPGRQQKPYKELSWATCPPTEFDLPLAFTATSLDPRAACCAGIQPGYISLQVAAAPPKPFVSHVQGCTGLIACCALDVAF